MATYTYNLPDQIASTVVEDGITGVRLRGQSLDLKIDGTRLAFQISVHGGKWGQGANLDKFGLDGILEFSNAKLTEGRFLHQYDSDGNLARYTRPDGSFIDYAWNARSLLASGRGRS